MMQFCYLHLTLTHLLYLVYVWLPICHLYVFVELFFRIFLRVYVKGKTLDTNFPTHALAHSHCSVVVVMVVGDGDGGG